MLIKCALNHKLIKRVLCFSSRIATFIKIISIAAALPNSLDRYESYRFLEGGLSIWTK